MKIIANPDTATVTIDAEDLRCLIERIVDLSYRAAHALDQAFGDDGDEEGIVMDLVDLGEEDEDIDAIREAIDQALAQTK